jgi:nitrite reductase/ring-hydroxylating ferredoxin subunit
MDRSALPPYQGEHLRRAVRKFVVAPVADIPPGTHKVFTVGGRPIGIFNLNGKFCGLLNRCPHQGGRLCDGLLTGLAVGGHSNA